MSDGGVTSYVTVVSLPMLQGEKGANGVDGVHGEEVCMSTLQHLISRQTDDSHNILIFMLFN